MKIQLQSCYPSDNRLNCTLWGEYADKMQAYLDSLGHENPVVVILQLCKFNKFQGSYLFCFNCVILLLLFFKEIVLLFILCVTIIGSMGISTAFNGTKLIINDENLPDILEYKRG